MTQKIKHLGIIMDGNRRWAKAMGKSQYDGHMAGANNIEVIVEAVADRKIPYLTFYSFSQENWERPEAEVNNLLKVFRVMLKSPVVERFKKNNIRMNMIGDYLRFPKDIVEDIEKLHEDTRNNSAMTVNFALGYGGRDEIVRSVNRILAKNQGETGITAEMIADNLDTAGQPDPDLLIRTGRVSRTSGFLLWQSIYAELYFSNSLWPDFNEKELQEALNWYDPDQRRFGK